MIYLKHIKYLFIHKWFVFIGCLKYGLFWQGVLHDWDKFLPHQLVPYSRYIYGNDKAVDIDRAILTHLNRSSHHWEHWVYIRKGVSIPLEMPVKYVLEMIADMHGAAKAKHEKPASLWYMRNKDKLILHKNTRSLLEKELLQ